MAILGSLPALGYLSAHRLSMHATQASVFSSLTSLILHCHGFEQVAVGGAIAAAMAVCAAAFPALQRCKLQWRGGVFPALPSLETAVLKLRPAGPLEVAPRDMPVGLAALAGCSAFKRLDLHDEHVEDLGDALESMLLFAHGQRLVLPSVRFLRLRLSRGFDSIQAPLPHLFPRLITLGIDADCRGLPAELLEGGEFCLAPLVRLSRLEALGIYRVPMLTRAAVMGFCLSAGDKFTHIEFSFHPGASGDVTEDFWSLMATQYNLSERRPEMTFAVLPEGEIGMDPWVT